jgi:hypothetical protein
MKYSTPEIIVFTVAALLPTYLIRFHIGPLPMTALEVVLVVGILILIFNIFCHPRAHIGGPIHIGRPYDQVTIGFTPRSAGPMSLGDDKLANSIFDIR